MGKLLTKEIIKICKILSAYYPNTRLHNKKNPLLEAIFILLSSQTTETNYLNTWSSFRHRFKTLEDAENASVSSIFSSIKNGGLGKWKAKRIKKLLKQVRTKYNKLSLSSLKKLDNDSLERELSLLDGIGIKSAKCIMMYSFDREVFPIDTHALRIIKRMGFVIPKNNIKSISFAKYIEKQIPSRLRFRFHVNLIQHGRQICKSKPLCYKCPVINYCLTGKKYFLKSAATDGGAKKR